jgi:hypothetical protein
MNETYFFFLDFIGSDRGQMLDLEEKLPARQSDENRSLAHALSKRLCQGILFF